MVVKGLYIVVLVALLVALAGCAPRTTPAPTPALVSPQAAPAKQAPTAPSLNPEEAAWQKVVAEAQKEGKATLYGAGIVGDIATSLSAAFQRRYGIKLELVAGVGAVHIERIKAEHRAGKSVADMLDTAIGTLILAKEDGLTASTGDDLPVLREKDAWVTSPPKADAEGHLVAYGGSSYPLFINTTVVKPGGEPRSYRELLEPRWRGEQISLTPPLTSAASNYVYVATKKAGTLDDDFWRRLRLKGIRIAPSLREPPSWLARGETAVALDTSDSNMAAYVKEGAPVKALEMEEGVTVLVGRVISLIKNAPHPNAARVFVNWLLSQEGQQVYAEAVGGVVPLRKDTPDLRPAALRVEMKKPLVVDLPMMLEAAKIQREGTLARLLGLEK